jgi:hypothetical protein
MIRAPGSRLALRPEQKYGNFQRFTVPESQLEPPRGISAGSVGRPAVDCAKPANKRGKFAGTLAGATGLEPATSGVTGRRSNQLNYAPRRTGV